MNRINARLHGWLDYLTILGLIVLPFFFKLPLEARWAACALALVHLIMTRLTDFYLGAVKLIPLAWHGRVELAVSIALIVVSFLPAIPLNGTARHFFQGTAIVICAVWWATDYSPEPTERR
jgi:hypothetical protein